MSLAGRLLSYQCWFCGKPVKRGDKAAVSIVASNLWDDSGETAQHFVAHSHCADERLKGHEMDFDSMMFLD